MGWLADAAFVTVMLSVFGLWWLDGRLIRRPGESLWQRYIAIKNGRPHVWVVFGPSLYLLAVALVATQTGSGWWLLGAVPAYGFLLRKLLTRRVPQRPRQGLTAPGHFADGPSGNVDVVDESAQHDR